jgi:hypothetical protein
VLYEEGRPNVTSRDARSLGREYGKKIDTFVVTPVPGQSIETVIRFKAEEGVFFVEWNDSWYSNVDVNELKAEVQKAAKAAAHLDWDPFIEMERQWDESTKLHYNNAGPNVPIVELNYRVIFLTRQTLKSAGTKWAEGRGYRLYKKADVDEATKEATPSSYDRGETYSNSFNKALVPYTPERMRVVEQIRAVVIAARAKLQAMCEGDGEKVGATLDAFTGRLLGAISEDADEPQVAAK